MVPFKIAFLTDGVPPFFFTQGLNISHSEFERMPVLTFAPPKPTTKVVVAIHGGAYVGEATIFHWWTYTNIARHTGATVLVPDYTLSPAGTAVTEVPRMADFISAQIEAHRAEYVSVLGDSAGGGLALLATQELVRRDSATPGRLVLLAPSLDVSMSDPRTAEIDDPLLDIGNAARHSRSWAGDLDAQDPRVSPLFASLDGLPSTFIYSSSRDLLTVDALRLRDRVVAEGLSNFTFRLRKGLIHDHIIYVPLPDARADRANLYHDLGLVDTDTPRSAMLERAETLLACRRLPVWAVSKHTTYECLKTWCQTQSKFDGAFYATKRTDHPRGTAPGRVGQLVEET